MTTEEKIRFELFDIKQKFLREVPHPKLILKEIKQLTKMGGLAPMLPASYFVDRLDQHIRDTSLLIYLDDYIKETLALRHQISLGATHQGIRSLLAELAQKQWILLRKLQSYLTKIPENLDKDVKMSKPIDAYQLLKGIQELNLEENEIKHYLCGKVKAFERDYDSIIEAFLRANKIVNHV